VTNNIPTLNRVINTAGAVLEKIKSYTVIVEIVTNHSNMN